MDWIESQINDENIFPVTTDVPFPKTFQVCSQNLRIFLRNSGFVCFIQPVCKKILTRLYRVFVHVYVHHFDRMMAIGAEPHVNTCYKHFYYFVTEFNLLNEKEFEPLKVIQKLLTNLSAMVKDAIFPTYFCTSFQEMTQRICTDLVPATADKLTSKQPHNKQASVSPLPPTQEER